MFFIPYYGTYPPLIKKKKAVSFCYKNKRIYNIWASYLSNDPPIISFLQIRPISDNNGLYLLKCRGLTDLDR